MRCVWVSAVPATLVAPLLLSGCTGGEALHRFVFDPGGITPQTTKLTLGAGEKLSFWNSLDVTYQAGTTLDFVININPESGTPVKVVCDALDPTSQFMSSTFTTGNTIRKSWKLAQMNCGFGPVNKSQSFTITVVPKANGTAPLEASRIVLELKG